jgi:hypothetical protein
MFIIPFIILFIVQMIKLVVDYNRWVKMTIPGLFSSWWFPSVHSAMSTSVVTLSYIVHGWDSMMFAVSFTFAFLLWYDAVNVRMEAWKHAMQINVLNDALKGKSRMQKPKGRKLKERIWHSPVEVIGGIVIGAILTVLLYHIYISINITW